ncbi:MAG: preprotein translocase subunit SecA [Patescibacteria group bacterium]
MSLLTKIFGDPNERFIKEVTPQVERINSLEAENKKLSDDALKAKTQEFKGRVEQGTTLDDLLPEAFAAVREAAGRTIEQRHFDVQLIGGMALHRGMIAEMRTGEGKTLTATLPLYLNALAGKGAHLVTVNDYLARLHASWMGRVYHALGLTVGCTQQQLVSYIYDPEAKKQEIPKDGSDAEEKEIARYTVDMDFLRPVTRKEAYAADITYGTNNEFGFDYLRDNMVGDLAEMAQRELCYAIVDEVDSILIDEARTPLIISAPAEESGDLYYKFADLVTTLSEGPDYNVDEKMRTATLTEEGVHKMERALNITNLYAEGGLNLVHHLEQALRAHALFKRDRDYVVKDNEVIIVDEFTGRLMFGRRYSEGLHQAIEAKEKVEIQRESRTLATVTFQNYFRLYKKLAGMTGTAVTEAEEFHKIYNLDVVSIPTHRPMIRKDLPDRIYKSANGKWQSIVQEVKVRHESGQPILIGTVSIEKNEHLSHLLSLEGIPHNVLNAKRHEEEARFIAQAGKRGSVTVATNMAGRGVDIILGGNPPAADEAALIKSLGGLHVIGTERHEARRIDNQLRGRAGRQGDPGSSQFFLSMEDDLMRIFGSDRMKGLMERMGMPEDMPIENRMVSKSIESAQRKVEGHNFDIRKHLVEYDDIINKHREVIYKKRREILNTTQSPDPSAISKILLNMIEEEISAVVLFHTSAQATDEWNLDEIYETVDSIVPLPLQSRIKIDEIHDVKSEKMGDAPKRTAIVGYLMGYVESHFKELETSINIALKSPVFINIERGILLRAIDTLWIEHLDAMDHLRTGIGLRGYGQRDPLVEYKRESYRMFTELLTAIRKEVVYSIFKIGAAQRFAQSTLAREQPMILSGPAKEMERARAASQAQNAAISKTTSFNGKKVGRNDPCPCGAKKLDGTPIKYKHCHGK